MTLELIDWISIGGFFLVSLIVGVSVAKRAGSSATEFFASGRSMPGGYWEFQWLPQLSLPTHRIW